MLKKLLKYDLQNIFKYLMIFYSLALFFGILTRLFLSIENSFILNIIGQVCSGATISMFFNILINNLIRLWVRFKNNFYGDESYLTHTLPVDKKILYLSKTLASLISLFTSVLVIGLTLFVAYYSKNNLELLKNLLLPIVNAYDSTIIKILFAFLFIFFLEFANGLQSGYTGTILGHRMNSGKIGFSVLFGFMVYIVSQIVVLFIIFVIGIFNHDIMNLFVTSNIENMEVVKLIIYMAIGIYIFICLLGYWINLKLFKKGVNVD